MGETINLLTFTLSLSLTLVTVVVGFFKINRSINNHINEVDKRLTIIETKFDMVMGKPKNE